MMFESTRDAAVTALERLFLALWDATVDKCAVVDPQRHSTQCGRTRPRRISRQRRLRFGGFAPAPSAFPLIFEIAGNHSHVINLSVRFFCIMLL
jgi:hypothetical protein